MKLEELLIGMGTTKATAIRRLCRIMDRKGEMYNVEEFLKMTREEIRDKINEEIDFPYQRFDS